MTAHEVQRIYSGADPVFDEGDIFRLTVPLDDDYSPEKGHLQNRQTIQAGVRQTRQQRGLIEHTLPNAKRSKFQKYRVTRRGHAVVENVLRSRKEVNQ